MNLANQEQEHIGELKLRRRRAGEALGPDAASIDAHAASCADCRARIRALDDEQRRFEQEISFDRFAAGVERAARSDRAARRPMRARVWIQSLAGVAAAAAMLVLVLHTLDDGRARRHGFRDGVKGGTGVTVRVARADGQRNARVDSTEPLARGERLRIGYQAGPHRYLLALTIDDHGVVQALSPEKGQSVALPDGRPSATRYLLDSWELDGAGVERIIV